MPSIYGGYTKEVRLRLDYSITSQSIENNTTLITMDLYAEKTAHSGYNRTGNSYYNMTGKGNTTVNWDWGSSSNQYYLGSSTTTVAHNADGTASTTLNGYWYLGNTTQYMPTELSVSGTITLPTIPRASSISLSSSNITLGQNLTININRASSNFTHSLYWQIGDGNWNTIVSNVATTYTWNVPKSLANSFPNTTSQTFRIICETYNGSNYIGSKSQNFTATISDDIKPGITSLTLSDTTSNSVYIETLSKINAKTVAAGVYGSSVTNYTVSMIINGTTKKTLYGSNVTFDLNNLNITQNTTATIKVTVTDSRGKTNTLSKTITVYRYIKPYIVSKSSFRCNSSGIRDENGTYLSLNWNYYVTTGIPGNEAKPLVQYRQKGTTSWTSVNLNNNATIIVGDGNISTDNQYEVKYAIGDNFYSNSTISITDTIQTGYVTVDYRAGGKGIAFGKVSEKDEFECNMVADFKQDINWESKGYNNTNFNTIKKSGTYYMGTGCTHAPENLNWCRLLVLGNSTSGDIVQIATVINSGVNYGRTFIRESVSSTWYAWSEINISKPISVNSNFNTFTGTGIYYRAYSTTGVNDPSDSAGILEVFKNNSLVTQRYTTYEGRLVFQRGFDKSWTPWLVRAHGLMACVYPSQRLSIGGTAWTNMFISLASSKSNTSHGLLTASNGGIKIGKGVNTVNVSASLCYYNFNATTEVDLKILKNGSQVAQNSGDCTVANKIFNITTNTVAINVANGDLIQLAIAKGSANNLTIINDNASTSLTVEILA